MALLTNLGYTTINNKWETLTNKELAKHDLLMQIYTRKGECDWDVNLGSTIFDKLFQPKTNAIRDLIKEEIHDIFDNDLRFSLINLETEDVEDGWYFICSVSYLNGTPEDWVLNITKSNIVNYSNGYYPLGEE